MASIGYLASAALMTLFVIAVVGAILRFGRWQSYSVTEPGGLAERWRRVRSSPAAWTATFLLLVFGIGGLAVLWVSGVEVPGAAFVGAALWGLVALAFTSYLFVGVYDAARSRGRPAAQGVFEGAVALGFLAVLAITVKLVV